MSSNIVVLSNVGTQIFNEETILINFLDFSIERLFNRPKTIHFQFISAILYRHTLYATIPRKSGKSKSTVFYLHIPQLNIEKINRLLNDQEIEIF